MIQIDNLPGEKWHEIEDAPGYYISNKGRLCGKRKLIKQVKNKNTGLMQGMVYDRPRHAKLLNIQKYVAMYFLPPKPHTDCIVRHKSEDLCDNRVENLEWGSRKHLGRYRPDPKFRYIIKQITQAGLVVATFVNWDALEKRGYRRRSIIAAAHNIYTTERKSVYKGYLWEVSRFSIKKDDGKEE